MIKEISYLILFFILKKKNFSLEKKLIKTFISKENNRYLLPKLLS